MESFWKKVAMSVALFLIEGAVAYFALDIALDGIYEVSFLQVLAAKIALRALLVEFGAVDTNTNKEKIKSIKW